MTLTLGSTGELEGGQASDGAKDLLLLDRFELARLTVDLQQFDFGTTTGDTDLLLLGAGELAHASAGDGRRREQRVVEQMHPSLRSPELKDVQLQSSRRSVVELLS